MKVTAIDFETANSNPASVCSVGISVMEEGCVEEAYYSLIKPEINVSDFNYWNIKIHGIHPEDVEDAPDFRMVYKQIVPYFDQAIVCAHNAPFDMNCLRKTCLNCGLKVPVLEYFDTVELSRRMFPGLARHRLNDVCDYLNVELDHHLASSDAYGCLMIVAHAMNLTGIYDIEEFLMRLRIRVREL